MSELEICPDCSGAGGDNNVWTCGKCGGSGGVSARPKPTGEVGDVVERLLSHVPSMRRYGLEHAAHHCEQAAAAMTALAAENEQKDGALKSVGAWLKRWAAHVGGCKGGSLCECGLTRMKYEVSAALGETQ